LKLFWNLITYKEIFFSENLKLGEVKHFSNSKKKSNEIPIVVVSDFGKYI